MNIRAILYRIFRYLPIKKRQVLFISYYGAQYGCNPKYISKYLVDHFRSEVDIIWAFNNPAAHKIEGVGKVKFASVRYLLALATSKVIITNYRMTTDFKKRNDQIYLQTWHSSMRLKKIEADTEDTLTTAYINMAKHDSKQTDFVIAGSGMSHNTFEKSFWYNGKILDIGTPRNDLLLNTDSSHQKNLKKSMGLDNDTKVVLYAPTFRKDKSLKYYNINIENLTHALKERFGGKWVVALRLHPHLINYKLFSNRQDVIDLTEYDDIQELLAVSDVLISDYSSLMFDFALTCRPIFLFASDASDYCKNDRALYFNFKDLPFPFAADNVQLGINIRNFEDRSYAKALSSFFASIETFENGEASKKISELILKISKQ